MLTAIRSFFGRNTRRRNAEEQTDRELPIRKELDTLEAIRLTDMAGLGSWSLHR
ncbi:MULTISPECIES: hypothetical protein [unclassified Mesorhizobium]|uniref:hypothetical protein n=1 Tax=unclassified Mesorhizobium TaxID=325217 RepID=UPI0015E3571B|nr:MULTISPECIES: hypothetical protein [unclassified Mesorhizobium]MBZ9701679.1 hypothetical protein [Mesorhizobium sp. CO1-1-3]MBZ9898272.1 hypothetical protein [Mesorhizobium sp. BR1-1-6]MBZ9949027.1 hypothetical protein [Mesorhizobium sp. BR1-1-11]MBZ9985201.1 hypothetical protein [Mesorhizobium sp. BR-1-1-8]